MYYSEKVKKAVQIAFEAHAGQLDQAGYPYFLHPYHLAEQMYDEDSTIVALLHDVVEDTSVTLDDLREAGFGEQVIEALTLLTHGKDVPYLEYVARIRENPLARRVKIADLRHNCDTTRGADTPYFKKKREDCYYPSLRMLLAAEGAMRVADERDLGKEGEAIGPLTILIQDERLLDGSSDIVKMLEKDGFREWTHGSLPRHKGMLYVDLNHHTYSYGRSGVTVTSFLGGKAVSCDDFLAIYRLYK